MNRRTAFLGAAAIALASAPAVRGNGALAQTMGEGAGASALIMDEIIVTARKRAEPLQDTPLAVSVVAEDLIAAAQLKTLDDVAKLTPGFSFDEDFQRSISSRPVIRGQSTVLGEPGVSIFIDGVLVTGPILDYDLGDVERIEVIKGPQSALYGRNTYAGAVSIITRSPTDELSGDARFEIGEFSQNDFSASLRGPLSETLAFSLRGRYYDRGGPFLNTFDSTRVGQQESKSLSGVLQYRPDERLNLRLRARWSELHDDQPRLFLTDPADNNCFPDIGALYNGNGRYFCGEIKERPIAIDDVLLLGRKGFDDNTSWQTSLSVDYRLSERWRLIYIGGYDSTDATEQADLGFSEESFNPFSLFFGGAPFNPGPLTPIAFIAGPVVDFARDSSEDSWDTSHEIRLAYEGGRWDLLIGGYYFDSKTKYRSNRMAPPDFATTLAGAYFGEIARMVDVCTASVAGTGQTCVAPVFNVALGANAFPDFAFTGNAFGLTTLELEANRDRVVDERRNLAAFAMVSGDLSERLSVSAEARIASEKIVSNTTFGLATYDYTGALLGTTFTPTPERSKTFTDVNPRFTARYALSDRTNLYAVVARGTKPGGLNDAEVIPLGRGAYKQEQVWSFELGAKNSLMDDQLVLNLAAFHNTINDYQLTEAVVVPSLNQTRTPVANKGKVRVMGLEIEAAYAPKAVEGLVLNLGYALTDSEFLRGTDINEGKLNDTLDDGRVNCSIGFADPSAPCGSAGDNVLPGSIVGRQLPRQAKHMLNLGAAYTRPLTGDWSLVLNGYLSHESKKFVQVHNLAWVGPATLLNASIGVENGDLRLVLWGKNLTDENAVVAVSRFVDEGASLQRAFMGNPRIGRQFGGTASYAF